MTPKDIATDVSSIQTFGSVTTSVMGTQSYVGQVWSIDDSRTWD